jgi:predicted restriction endonuclease
MTGRVQQNYRLTSTFRKAIRRSFADRCAICDWDGAPCDVCHIIARKNGGTDTLSNVVMLCPNHHRRFDLGLIPVEVIRRARETVLRHPPPPST